MRNPWKLTSFALAGALAFSLASSAIAEPQPAMRDALAGLRTAKGALESANHDKGGHRAKALELTRAAIQEVEAGIKFDNHH